MPACVSAYVRTQRPARPTCIYAPAAIADHLLDHRMYVESSIRSRPTFSRLGPSGRKYTPNVQDYFTYGSSWPSSGHAHRHPTSTEALARFSHLYIYIKPWEAGQGRPESIHEHEALRSSQRNRATGSFAAPSDAFVLHRRAAGTAPYMLAAFQIPTSEHSLSQSAVRSPSPSAPLTEPVHCSLVGSQRDDETSTTLAPKFKLSCHRSHLSCNYIKLRGARAGLNRYTTTKLHEAPPKGITQPARPLRHPTRPHSTPAPHG